MLSKEERKDLESLRRLIQSFLDHDRMSSTDAGLIEEYGKSLHELAKTRAFRASAQAVAWCAA